MFPVSASTLRVRLFPRLLMAFLSTDAQDLDFYYVLRNAGSDTLSCATHIVDSDTVPAHKMELMVRTPLPGSE